MWMNLRNSNHLMSSLQALRLVYWLGWTLRGKTSCKGGQRRWDLLLDEHPYLYIFHCFQHSSEHVDFNRNPKYKTERSLYAPALPVFYLPQVWEVPRISVGQRHRWLCATRVMIPDPELWVLPSPQFQKVTALLWLSAILLSLAWYKASWIRKNLFRNFSGFWTCPCSGWEQQKNMDMPKHVKINKL